MDLHLKVLQQVPWRLFQQFHQFQVLPGSLQETGKHSSPLFRVWI